MPNQQKHFSRSTIADVAEMAGVSIATVSRVLNNNGNVIPETTLRVKQAMDALNYHPRAAARGLASNRTNAIGLLLPGIGKVFFSPTLRGIEQGVKEGGFDLMIYSTGGEPPHPSGRGSLAEHNTDGLIIFTDILNHAEVARLHAIGFPIVYMHQNPPGGMLIPHISFENKAGARAMMDHLVEVHGYRRIAFLRGEADNEDSDWREQGYREALAAHGLPYDPALVGKGDYDMEVGEAQVAEWLSRGIRPDAIFAADDDSAFGAITALKKAGLNVPQDIAVVGFDDIPNTRYMDPPLTTVHAPIEEAGYEAARKLVNLIQNGETDLETLLPTHLAIRRSCGCEHPG